MKNVSLPDVEKEMARLEDKEIQEAMQLKREMMADSGSNSPLLRKHQPYERERLKVGRNDPCPCGSGKKSKKCCPPKVKYKEKL